MPVPLLFAGRSVPVSLLGFPPRPGPRRLPALLAAIALPRMSRPKVLLTSFEQTLPGAGPAHQSFASAALLIFGLACSTLGRAQGRSLLPEALPRRGWHSSPGRSRSSGQYEINNSIAQIGFWLTVSRAGVTMISPGETEAGTAGMQPCRGITWRAHRDDDRSAEAPLLRSSRTPIGSVDPDALKIPARTAECSLTENARSPFHAEPGHRSHSSARCTGSYFQFG